MDEILQELSKAAMDLFGDRLVLILQGQHDEINRLQEEVSRLQDLVEQLEARLAALERIPQQPGDVSRNEAPSTFTEADYVHYELRDKYRHIVEHLLVGIAEKHYTQEVSSGQSRTATEAKLISELTSALFGEASVNQDRVNNLFAHDPAAEDVLRVCDEASELRAHLADTTNADAQSWDFGFEKGKQLDPDRQAVWPSCPNEAPVCFVVAPAYMLHNRILYQQQVYTEQIETEEGERAKKKDRNRLERWRLKKEPKPLAIT